MNVEIPQHAGLADLGTGADHSYIDQDVTSGASPTFDGTNFTGIPDGGLDETYLQADGSVALAGAWNMGSQAITNANIDTGDIAIAVTNSEWDAAYTHSQDNSQAHTDYMLNTGDISTGDIEIAYANDGGDVNLTLRNTAGAGSTDESASIIVTTTGSNSSMGKIVFDREGSYAGPPGNYDSSMSFYTVGSSSETVALTIDESQHLHLPFDNKRIYFGTAKDASIYYDGTDLVIDPQLVGSGTIDIKMSATDVGSATGNTCQDFEEYFVIQLNGTAYRVPCEPAP